MNRNSSESTSPTSSAALPVVLFSIALCVSAFLLFAVQLMVAKMVLPMLGGTPAVWNTCMVFFQALLLAGYCYAHVTTAWLGARRQAAIHALLLFLPFGFLPIGVASNSPPPVEANPIPWLLALMLKSVGLPFFVVSTTAPLLQKWLAHTAHSMAKDPYFLYAASNLGSLLALLSYPVVVEPHLRLGDQSLAWAGGYTLFVVLTLGCAGLLWRWPVTISQDPSPDTTDVSPRVPSRITNVGSLTFSRRLWWVMLSLVPSSLMLGLTTYLSTDIAPIPLLWVIPLSLYLLTFVLVFARKPLVPHAWMVRALPLVILPLTILMVAQHTKPIWPLILLHLLMLFVTAMVCHGELAKDRPPTQHLTEFYLWLSIGGVLGGLFNALIAPLIFDTVIEYPLAMCVACLLRPGTAVDDERPRSNWLDYVMPATLGMMVAGFALALRVSAITSPLLRIGLLCVPPAVVCYTSRYRPIRFGLCIGAFLFIGMLFTEGWERVLHVERSFFGVYRVMVVGGQGGPYHKLEHGTTLHGMQSLNPSRRHEPLTYYHPTGPLGQVFDAFAATVPRLQHVAVIGLGTGSTACYASPGQRWTFYEIDPLVKRLATDPQYFTYLRDCLETFDVVLGDARLSLRRAPDKQYDLIIIDAFSSDAIPIHLLTQEALHLYLAKLADGGMVVFHISNRYLELEPVLGALTKAAGLAGVRLRDTRMSDAEAARGKTVSDWVAIARTREDLRMWQRKDSRWRQVRTRPGVAAWTDDFSNVLSVFRWR